MGTSVRSNRKKALKRVRKQRVPLSSTVVQMEERKQEILQQCLAAPKLEIPVVQQDENQDVKMQEVKIKKGKKKKNRGVELMMSKDPKTEAVKKLIKDFKTNRKQKRLEKIQQLGQTKKPAAKIIQKEFKKAVGDRRRNRRKYRNRPRDYSDVV